MNKIILNKCPICASTEFRCIFTPKPEDYENFIILSNRKYHGVMNEWSKHLSLQLYRCKDCHHIWHSEIPSAELISLMYSSTSTKTDAELEIDSARSKYIQAELSFFKSVASDSDNARAMTKFLDFGCGRGLWLEEATRVGFENIIAYDPSHKRIENSKWKNISYFNSLENLCLQGPFDFINCEQVLEHGINPLETLTSIQSLCHKNSLVRLTVPLLSEDLSDSEITKNFPYRTQQMHLLSPYEHLHGFSRKSFKLLYTNCGFEPMKICFKQLFTYPKQTLKQLTKKSNFIILKPLK